MSQGTIPSDPSAEEDNSSNKRFSFVALVPYILLALVLTPGIALTYWETHDLSETRFSLVNLLVMTIGVPAVLWFGKPFSNAVEKTSRWFSATRMGTILTGRQKSGEKTVSYVILFVAGGLLMSIGDEIFSPPVGFVVGGVALARWTWLVLQSGDTRAA